LAPSSLVSRGTITSWGGGTGKFLDNLLSKGSLMFSFTPTVYTDPRLDSMWDKILSYT
jgi:hypothetical protein